MTSNLTMRIDTRLRRDAETLFSELGMPISTALTIFLRQAVREQALPFKVGLREVPNDDTIAAIAEAETAIKDPAAKRYSYKEYLKHMQEICEEKSDRVAEAPSAFGEGTKFETGNLKLGLKTE